MTIPLGEQEGIAIGPGGKYQALTETESFIRSRGVFDEPFYMNDFQTGRRQCPLLNEGSWGKGENIRHPCDVKGQYNPSEFRRDNSLNVSAANKRKEFLRRAVDALCVVCPTDDRSVERNWRTSVVSCDLLRQMVKNAMYIPNYTDESLRPVIKADLTEFKRHREKYVKKVKKKTRKDPLRKIVKRDYILTGSIESFIGSNSSDEGIIKRHFKSLTTRICHFFRIPPFVVNMDIIDYCMSLL